MLVSTSTDISYWVELNAGSEMVTFLVKMILMWKGAPGRMLSVTDIPPPITLVKYDTVLITILLWVFVKLFMNIGNPSTTQVAHIFQEVWLH